MASLTGQLIGGTYKDLLTVSGGTSNEGLETSVKQIFDGDGIGSPLWIGTNSLQITDTMTITGTLNLQNKESEPANPTTGDIAIINGKLYFAS
tara:strand:+ start:1761 stop:2039 length:279 start_codon:yes stop_codon:yes gene_type:complete